MAKLGFISANNFTKPYPVYPIGVSYLTTYLEDNLDGWQIDIFDFNLNGSYSELKGWILNGKFDIIAISLRNIDDIDSQAQNYFVDHYIKVISTIKECSNVKIIVGGPGFSIFPELLYQKLNIDFGIKGEGELSMCKLINAIYLGKSFKAIEGLVYRDENGEIVVNPRKEYVKSACLRMNGQSVPFYFEKGGMLNVQTKRGCPFSCIYCTYPEIDGHKVRNLDAGQVIDNIINIYSKYSVNYLFFTDSVFNIDRKYNEDLCRRIIDSGINLQWGAYFNPRDLNKDDLMLYKESGLTHIEWGTDTLADKTLITYNKGFTWPQIKQAHKWASDLGIFQAHFMILGGYGETIETLKETFERSKELESALFFPYIGMRIYPNTKLCDLTNYGNQDLLKPVYYISPETKPDIIKDMAARSGAKWIFTGMEDDRIISKLRSRHYRGPLWEFLKY